MTKESDSCARKRRFYLLISVVAALAASGWACSSGEGAETPGSAGAGGQAAGAGTSGTANAGTGNTGTGNTGTGNTGTGNTGTGNTGTGNTGAGSTGTGATGAGGVTAVGTTLCTNGKDDDGDGLIDGFDPECTGPADNDESSFATGIPGDNRDPKWQDCFFDGDSGAGNDGCRYATECLQGTLPLTDPDCTVTQQCLDFCRPLAPNGCDCFGCCTVQLENGSTIDILEMATCSLENLDDTTACPRCTKSTQCGNTCGDCELCLGKTVADLPASCTPTGTGGTGAGGQGPVGGQAAGGAPPAYTCDNGAQVCSPDRPCSATQYCSMGCCLAMVF